MVAPPGTTVQLTSSGMQIVATVHTSDGHPATGVRIDFAAPSSGPSCTLDAPFVITDLTGIATVTCRPNCRAGSYQVSATPLAHATPTTVALSYRGRCRLAVRH